ncbi:MAG TPA: DNA-directed RNA polymerase subunit L [Methanocorpusculum sp.]|nr:DNA-directed RNA polymerase subunit L [Methanocorpusculum sp.]HJJ92490.1 DNA-directed RNA polymerase subunit L [Methanocorpusculum sp.]HJK01430.1 DNA-directed RNA polymerase subunit L [Methanocorpusculum sp.]
MKLKIIELEKSKIRLSLEGEGHTFMNALVEEILTDPEVDVAKYVIEFQFSDPELFITMKEDSKKDPILVIHEACGRLSKRCDDLLGYLKN